MPLNARKTAPRSASSTRGTPAASSSAVWWADRGSPSADLMSAACRAFRRSMSEGQSVSTYNAVSQPKSSAGSTTVFQRKILSGPVRRLVKMPSGVSPWNAAQARLARWAT